MALALADRLISTAPQHRIAAGPRGAVAVGLVAIAVVHLLDLPGKSPGYLAALYVVLIAACAGLATLVLVARSRAVPAAAAGLALGVVVAYVLTRTTGLPGAVDDIGNWAEPLGVVAVATEVATAWFALLAVVLETGVGVLRTLRT